MEWNDYFIHKDKVLFRDEENKPVLRNNLDITSNKELAIVERVNTNIVLKRLLKTPVKGKFDLKHYQKIHNAIFSKIYPPEIAGGLRQGSQTPTKAQYILGGRSVEYSPPEYIKYDAELALKKLNAIDFKENDSSVVKNIAKHLTELWVTHPFMEGNTRTTAVFLTQFCQHKNFSLDMAQLNRKESFRDSLVLAADNRPQQLQENIILIKINLSK